MTKKLHKNKQSEKKSYKIMTLKKKHIINNVSIKIAIIIFLHSTLDTTNPERNSYRLQGDYKVISAIKLWW